MLHYLFDTSEFVTRDHCGVWSEFLIIIYMFSNLLIVISYFSISLQIFIIWLKRKQDFKYPVILVMFILFIFFCGITHLTDILVFHWAAYRLFTLILFITGILSIITALYMPIKLKYLLSLPTPRQFEVYNLKLKKTLEDKEYLLLTLNNVNKDLEIQIKTLKGLDLKEKWFMEQEQMLKQLKQVIKEIEVKNGI